MRHTGHKSDKKGGKRRRKKKKKENKQNKTEPTMNGKQQNRPKEFCMKD